MVDASSAKVNPPPFDFHQFDRQDRVVGQFNPLYKPDQARFEDVFKET